MSRPNDTVAGGADASVMDCFYRINWGKPDPAACWDSDDWLTADIGEIAVVRPEGSSHRPIARFRLLHDGEAVFIRFRVEDRFVRVAHTQFQDPVCRDSCVEFFVQPLADAGYFNFEINAGGALHVCYIEDPRRTPNGFAVASALTADEGAQVTIHTTLPPLVDPELPGPVIWELGCRIPIAMLAGRIGRPTPIDATWTGNFYKLASGSSHPHWLSWQPVGPSLDFHCPAYFGRLQFMPKAAAVEAAANAGMEVAGR